MADDILSQKENGEHSPAKKTRDDFTPPDPVKELFYYGSVMCQLIDDLYESVTVIDNENISTGCFFVGGRDTYAVLLRLLTVQKNWQERAAELLRQGL